LYTLADILSPSFLFGYIFILADWTDIIKSKFGHLGHSDCDMYHITQILSILTI